MDVTKAPPTADLASVGVGTVAGSATASPNGAAAGVSTASNASTAAAAAPDRLDIHPLDVAAALQILIAEVRAELPLLVAVSPAEMVLGMEPTYVAQQAEPLVHMIEVPMQESLPEAPVLAAILLGSVDLGQRESLLMPPGMRLASPAQASPVLMRLFLQAVPEDAGNPARWSATVIQLEVTLQSALDRAVAAVEQWRNVPQVVVDAARETRSVVMSQLSDEPPGPLWLRPEWLWLSPRMERFRRRRRLARRGLTDPDLWSLREDDTRQEAPETPPDEP
jgi:hypothetical protein